MTPETNSNEAMQQTLPYNLVAILQQHGLIKKPIPQLNVNNAVNDSVSLLNSPYLNQENKKTRKQENKKTRKQENKKTRKQENTNTKTGRLTHHYPTRYPGSKHLNTYQTTSKNIHRFHCMLRPIKNHRISDEDTYSWWNLRWKKAPWQYILSSRLLHDKKKRR